MVERVVVTADWAGDSLNGSRTAAALRVSAPGRYVMELPTRELRLGSGGHRAVLPSRLIVEIAPPEADILQLARDLLAEEPRWEGRCVFCWQPDHAPHVDDCIIARARRHLALIEAEAHEGHRRWHPAAGRSVSGQPPPRGGPRASQ